jgi:hypothetical protein
VIIDWIIVGGSIAGAAALLAWKVAGAFRTKKAGCGSGCGSCGTPAPEKREFRV